MYLKNLIFIHVLRKFNINQYIYFAGYSQFQFRTELVRDIVAIKDDEPVPIYKMNTDRTAQRTTHRQYHSDHLPTVDTRAGRFNC